MSLGGMEKVLLYINLTKFTYNMRAELFLELGPRILFTMHQLLPCLFSSLYGNGKGLQWRKREFWLKLTMWLSNIGAKGEYRNGQSFYALAPLLDMEPQPLLL
jgi:hypothetical protein